MPKTLGIKVTSDKFGDDFQSKLRTALVKEFGEDTDVNFQEAPVVGEGDKKEELEATVEELKDKVEELETEVESYKRKLAKYENGGDVIPEDKKAELIEELKDTVEKLEEEVKGKDEEKKEVDEDKKEVEEEFAKFKEEVRKKDIDAIIADGEKEGRIVPANREQIRSMLIGTDSKKVVKFSQDGKTVEKSQWDLTVEIVKSLPKQVNYEELSKDGEVHKFNETIVHKSEELKVDEAELAAQAEVYSQKNKVPYDEALIKVSKQSKK